MLDKWGLLVLWGGGGGGGGGAVHLTLSWLMSSRELSLLLSWYFSKLAQIFKIYNGFKVIWKRNLNSICPTNNLRIYIIYCMVLTLHSIATDCSVSNHCLCLNQGMWESYQWLGVRQWFSLGTLVISTSYNWMVKNVTKMTEKVPIVKITIFYTNTPLISMKFQEKYFLENIF